MRLSWVLPLILVAPAARAQEADDEPTVASEVRVETPPAPPRDVKARESWLRARLDGLVAARPDLAAAKIGIAVVDAASGRKLYARNAAERLKLASNAKIITAAAALSILGPEYTYRTTLFADKLLPDGTVQGNLYLRGSGDPSLDTAALWGLVHELELIGVTRVTGALVIDESAFDGVTMPPVYDEKKEDAWYRAPVSAASLNDSVIKVWVQPGKAAGAPARVKLDPPSDYFVVESTATTVAGGRTALTVGTAAVPGKLPQTRVTVAGTIRLDAVGGEMARKRVEHPGAYLGATLRRLLARSSVKLAGKTTRFGPVPRTARPLASRRSQPVGVLVREMSKTSNNFMAEALLKTISLEVGGAPATWPRGVAAVKQRLAELGIPAASYEYKNGAGLYASAFASAETMARILAAAARDFRYGPDLIAALAVAGADGTLGHRMYGGPAERYVRGKSGSLRGVACLTGFAGGNDRPLLAFSVLVNEIPDTPAAARAARGLADAVAEHLVLYLEADR